MSKLYIKTNLGKVLLRDPYETAWAIAYELDNPEQVFGSFEIIGTDRYALDHEHALKQGDNNETK